MTTAKYEWLHRLGFQNGVSYPEPLLEQIRLAYGNAGGFATIPGGVDYIPPFIPRNDDLWLEQVRELTRLSAQALICDLWTQILVLKRDHKEKPIYLLWDHDIPQPNPLTSLFWLLTCEAWPMPNHVNPCERSKQKHDLNVNQNPNLSELFPPQPHVLPQSTPLGFTATEPHGWARGTTIVGTRGLGGLLHQAIHRDDRHKMEQVQERTPIYRPGFAEATAQVFHVNRPSRNVWMRNQWPRMSIKWYDHGLAIDELQESWHHHQALSRLRDDVMTGVATRPGLPTHMHNVQTAPAGMWIRSWSEIGLTVKGLGDSRLKWTEGGEAITLAGGTRIGTTPPMAPRVWLGWTCLGPKWEMEEGLPQRRLTSASEEWVAAYAKHRPQALQMLFSPESVNIEEIVEDNNRQRGAKLSRAGRVVKAGAAPTGANRLSAFAAMINNAATDKLKGE